MLQPGAGGGGTVGAAAWPSILGLDPGTRIAGFALLRAKVPLPRNPGDFTVEDAGVLKVAPAQALNRRLGLLHEGLFQLLTLHRPQVCVIERPFFGKNASSALMLGEARGAFIAACARAEVAVAEITPAEVKKTVAGGGAADKETVSRVLQAMIGFHRGRLPHDVTDAVAIGLCHAIRTTMMAVACGQSTARLREERR